MGIVGREHWARKGEGSSTLTKRRERLPEYLASPRRAISVELAGSSSSGTTPGWPTRAWWRRMPGRS